MSVEQTGDGQWRVSMPWVCTLEQMENIAESIEAGEVQGGFTLHCPAEFFDALTPRLRDRLRGYVFRLP